MQEPLKVASIQSDLVWENPKKNRKQLSEKIKSIKADVDVIVLPEMFSTGFTMNASKVAEPMDGDTVSWMQKKAMKTRAAIVGSLIISEDNRFYNRLIFVEPSGALFYYDKRHTFTLANEHKVYTAGNKKLIIDYKGWKICPLICYDLRFPVWSRNVEEYDILLFVANWPKPRIQAWDILLKARAIENMCYCIGVNRVGTDEAQNEYCGHSAVYDILGNAITPLKPNREHIEIVTLEKKHIHFYRTKLQFLSDRDHFSLD
ncbi:amidohydrolase [Aestuariivivens sediminicola]|uniref:amidohydrolase n=1 Tax=Aestuariivivens sediminicola TaxID=2913560 RepID=UPI001F592642|nr:amidohydrolase [Aestuariivivens sediminicola]